MKIRNNFKFIGTLSFKEENNGIREIESATGWRGQVMEIKIKAGTGIQYPDIFGGIGQDKAYCMSEERDSQGKAIKLVIPRSKWEDEETLDTIADWSCLTIEGEKFVAEELAIKHLVDNKEMYEGRDVKVWGSVSLDEYNGVVRPKFAIKGITTDIYENEKEGFYGMLGVYITKDTIPKEYKSKGKIDYSAVERDRMLPLNVYADTPNKDKNTKKDMPILRMPLNVRIKLKDVFDFGNEKHMARLKLQAEQFLTKKVCELGVEVEFYKGAEEVSQDEVTLTPFEESLIETGMKTRESILKGKEVRGEFISEIRLKNFDVKNYPQGREESLLTEDDLLQVVETVEKPKEKVVVNEEEDLF